MLNRKKMASLLHRQGLRKSITAKVLSISGPLRKRPSSEVAKLSVGTFSELGPKHSANEDRAAYKLYPTLSDENVDSANSGMLTGFVGIFDGHGGAACSDYVSKVVETHLKESFCDQEAWENGEEVMREVFHNIDKEFCEIARAKKNLSGSCATIIAFQDTDVLIGNIGDCKAVLSPVNEKGAYENPVELTEDHRADSTSEELRIQEAGGQVKNGRILSLQPSRSFGDIDVKQLTNKDVVIADPHIDRIQIFINNSSNENRPFLVVATDGVWDVLNAKQVITHAKTMLKKFQWNANICSEKIVELAISKGSTDDITCAVIVW